MITLATDIGPVPMQVGAIIVLDAGPGFELSGAEAVIAGRLCAIPRLRQRIIRVPPGCGHPVWVDDADFDIGRHMRRAVCPPPGDERALLDLGAEVVTGPLPHSRPLWAVVTVTGLADGKIALIMVFHHVLADGIGGLAVLAGLADSAPGMTDGAPGMTDGAAVFPRLAPSRRALAADAGAARLRAISHLPATFTSARRAMAELGVARTARAPRTSLNQPTGPARKLTLARTDLADIHSLAHAHGATVNDAVLAAVTGAMHTLLNRRGEDIGTVVASVPVSARASATTSHLGNQTGVMPVAIPFGRDPVQRMVQIAGLTGVRKTAAPGASAAVLSCAFRALATAHLLRWFMNHQRRVTTFVTNLRGPAQALSLAGATVSAVIPISLTTGNVTVGFAVMSYAGALTITVLADPDLVPDVDVLTAALQAELDGLTSKQAWS